MGSIKAGESRPLGTTIVLEISQAILFPYLVTTQVRSGLERRAQLDLLSMQGRGCVRTVRRRSGDLERGLG